MILYVFELIYMSAFSGTLAAVLSLSRTWEGHFYGEFKLSAHTATQDWRVYLTFSVPISNLQVADDVYVSHVKDGVEWFVSGKHSWSQIGEEQYIPINIEGDYDFYDGQDEDIWGTAFVEAPGGDDYEYSQPESAIFITSPQSEYTTKSLSGVAPTVYSDASLPIATPAPQGTPGSTIDATESNDLSRATTAGNPNPTTGANPYPTTVGYINPTTAVNPKPTTSGHFSPTAAEQWNPSAAGNFNPTAAGNFNPTAAGNFNPTAAGQFNPTAAGNFNPTASENFNPTAAGQFNPTAGGHFNPTEAGHFNPTAWTTSVPWTEGVQPNPSTGEHINPSTGEHTNPTPGAGTVPHPTTADIHNSTTVPKLNPTTAIQPNPTTAHNQNPSTLINLNPTTASNLRMPTPENRISPTVSQSDPPTAANPNPTEAPQPNQPTAESPSPPRVTSPITTTTTESAPFSFLWKGPKSCERLVKVIQPEGAKRKYDYPLALAYSLLFYEAQRSGKLPENSRVPWRGDSALEDGQDEGLDLTGGWYDAGDNVKFGFPMASSTTMLIWGLLQWKDAYEATGQLDYMYDSVKWPLDYFIKCHSAPDELYVQVGDADYDHQYWGRPEDMFMERPSFKINATYPGSDVAAETAAAMAAGSIAFRNRDAAYADQLLSHAEQLYEFANKYRGLYTDSVPEASVFYESSNYFDELAWAACWLYKATWKQKYLTQAEELYPAAVNVLPWAFSWDDKRIGVEALLWNITQNPRYQYDIDDALSSWLPGGGWNYTTKGLAYCHKWGSLRYAENGAFIALMVADYGLAPDLYRPWAVAEMHYALGDTGRSFVVGFGKNSPKNPHHRASSCRDMPRPCGWEAFNNTRDNPQPLCGALVGGPDENDFYKDDRKDYISNEVACDYNAGYQSALAGLIHLSMTNQLPP